MFPLPLSHLQWLKQPCWLLVLATNKVPYVSLHLALVKMATKILVHHRATWMHDKSRVVKLPENLLSQISQLGNHYPFSIPKTTICVDDPALVKCTCARSLMDTIFASGPWDSITLLNRDGVATKLPNVP